MLSKRLCSEFENEIHITRYYHNGLSALNKNLNELYECNIRCHLRQGTLEEDKRALKQKQKKKGCDVLGYCGPRVVQGCMPHVFSCGQCG